MRNFEATSMTCRGRSARLRTTRAIRATLFDGQRAFTTADEMVKQIEESVKNWTEAEQPFLTGMGALPKDEFDKVLGDSKRYANEAN